MQGTLTLTTTAGLSQCELSALIGVMLIWHLPRLLPITTDSQSATSITSKSRSLAPVRWIPLGMLTRFIMMRIHGYRYPLLGNIAGSTHYNQDN